MNTLKVQSDFFDNNQESLLSQYEGKVLIISSDCKVDAFQTLEGAYLFGVKNYGLGNFMMKECKREEIGKVHFIPPCIIHA